MDALPTTPRWGLHTESLCQPEIAFSLNLRFVYFAATLSSPSRTGAPHLLMNTYESLQIGDSFTFDRVLTREDVDTFADLTGDDNPIHVDADYAADTQFGKPIVHGVLLLGIISKVLGRDFPGYGSIAVAISCRFLRPVAVGSEITVEVKIAEKIEKRKHVKVRIYVYTGGKMALGGEGTLIPPTDDGKVEM
jgi:acyl dehydratase